MSVMSSNVRRLMLLVVLVAVGACTTVRLVSEYDDITDKSATEMQHRVDFFLLRMESAAGTPAGRYSANSATYDSLQSDADALHVRASAVSNNSITLRQVAALDSALADLRKLHQAEGDMGLPSKLAEPSRSAFTSIFTAIITLELAKKRGQSTTSP
jgi:hypothetical protein